MSSQASHERELSASFIPADIESALYSKWLSAGYFTAGATSSKEPFTIVLPPPNVTGVLHIGHALDQTLQDCLSRMKRMKGFEVLWLPGMDHAGIATQNVVESNWHRKESLDTISAAKHLLHRSGNGRRNLVAQFSIR